MILSVGTYVYIYLYICVCMYMCVCVYVYIYYFSFQFLLSKFFEEYLLQQFHHPPPLKVGLGE